MLSQLVSWSCIALESVLLFRGLRSKLGSRYPAFYTYISFVLFQDLLCYFAFRWAPHLLYTYIYWITEFLCILLSCGIVLEVYRVGLSAYPGTARITRKVLGLVFVVALAKALVSAANDPRWWLEATAKDVAGTLRAVQGVAIVALVSLFLFYAIPFGRNLRGILVGYGLFVCWTVICLTLSSSVNDNVHAVLKNLYQSSYPVFLIFWLVHLWSYQTNPASEVEVPLEREYERIAAATRRRLQDARGQLAKVVGS
ncbi:MAG: hypothetical protein ABSH13_12190 [Candidatus Acidiferrum sp.]|jgi:hypothetical protein